MRRLICITACLWFEIAASTSPVLARTPSTQREIDAQQTRVSELESESGRIARELSETAGTTNVGQAINDVRSQMNELQTRDQALEEAIKQTGATEQELAALREGAANATVVGIDDVATEGAEKAAEREALRRLSKGAGKTLGVAGAVIDVIEYGGKYYYRWRTVRSIRADERAQRANVREFYKILIDVRTRYNQLLAKLKVLEDLRNRDRANFAALAEERQKLNDMKAGRNPQRDTDAAGDRALQAEEDAYQRRQSRERARRGVTLSGAIMSGDWQGPRPIYIGTENALTTQFFAVEDLKTDDGFNAADVHLGFGVANGLALIVGGTFQDISFGSRQDRFDPMGQKLLLPGVTTPGTALSAGVPEGTPGGFNVVENLNYSFKSDASSAYALLAHDYAAPGVDLVAYAGLAYSSSDQWQYLGGAIPGYGPQFSFAYDTQFETEVIRGVLGGRATISPFDGAPWLHLNAGGNIFLNFADTSGWDQLTFNNATESLNIGKDEFTLGWSAGVGVEADADDVTFFANYRYVEDETTPIAVRHDDGLSRAEFARSSAHLGSFGVRLAL